MEKIVLHGHLSMARGFTLPEIVVTIGILTTLLGISSINLLKTRQNVSLSATTTQLIADIKSQQVKAMVGNTMSGTATHYGIHFDEDQYILFQGASYVPSDATNTRIQLTDSVRVASAGETIIFSHISGEATSSAAITLQDSTNASQKTVHINRYGVVTSVD